MLRKCSSQITETSVCYQHFFHQKSKTRQHTRATVKIINSIPAKISTVVQSVVGIAFSIFPEKLFHGLFKLIVRKLYFAVFFL